MTIAERLKSKNARIRHAAKNELGTLESLAAGSERDFQRVLVRDLRRVLPADVFMTCFPAGTFRGKGRAGAIRGNQLNGMGLTPGVPDLLFIHRGEARWMELKTRRGVVSDVQTQCIETLSRCGSHVAVVRTLADAYRALDFWGFPTRIASAA